MFEAYNVAVKLTLRDGVTAGLMGLMGSFRSLHGSIATTNSGLMDMERRLKGIRTLGLAGGLTLGAGAMGLGMFEAPIKAAREYELVFNKFRNLNLGDVINSQADKFARGAGLMGISATQLMQTLSESVGIFGSYAQASKLAPMIASVNAANAAIYQGKVGAIDDGASRSLMQFIDRRGGTKDEAGFRSNLDLAEKLVTGSGGFLKFGDLASFSQQGGTAFRGLSDQGILNYAAILQEQGGRRAGTALMSIYQNLIAGRTPAKTMLKLQELGIGQTSWQTHMTAAGKQVKSLVMTHPVAEALLSSDPVSWFRQDFLPLLAAKGITSQSDILRVTNDLLSNRNASGQASLIDTQMFQVLRDAKLTSNALGYNDVIAAWKKDPNSAFADLTARWNDTLITLGRDTLPTAIKGINGLNTSLSTMTKLMDRFPKTTTGVAIAGAGLATVATVGGSLMLAVAGFRALGLTLAVGKGLGLGGQLMEVAGGLGAIAAKAGLLGAAGAGGYYFGKWINSFGPGGDLGGFLGGKLFEATHSDPNASWHGVAHGSISRGPSQYVPPNQPPAINFYVHNKLDRHGLTTAIFDEAGRQLNRPQTGPSFFDDSAALMPAGGLPGH
jgi:hypothetical protein